MFKVSQPIQICPDEHSPCATEEDGMHLAVDADTEDGGMHLTVDADTEDTAYILLLMLTQRIRHASYCILLLILTQRMAACILLLVGLDVNINIDYISDTLERPTLRKATPTYPAATARSAC